MQAKKKTSRKNIYRLKTQFMSLLNMGNTFSNYGRLFRQTDGKLDLYASILNVILSLKRFLI